MENFGMATVVVLTVISYLVGEAVKLVQAAPDTKRARLWTSVWRDGVLPRCCAL